LVVKHFCLIICVFVYIIHIIYRTAQIINIRSEKIMENKEKKTPKELEEEKIKILKSIDSKLTIIYVTLVAILGNLIGSLFH